jgi:hypothetical protein
MQKKMKKLSKKVSVLEINIYICTPVTNTGVVF